MPKSERIDNFFAMHSARTDSWRNLLSCARDWAAGSGSKAKTEEALAEIAVIEEFHAFPGVRLMNRLRGSRRKHQVEQTQLREVMRGRHFCCAPDYRMFPSLVATRLTQIPLSRSERLVFQGATPTCISVECRHSWQID